MQRTLINHQTYKVGPMVEETIYLAIPRQPGRRYLLVVNNDASVDVWLTFGETQPVFTSGSGLIKIAAGGGYYEREGEFCPRDKVWLGCSGGNTESPTVVSGYFDGIQ